MIGKKLKMLFKKMQTMLKIKLKTLNLNLALIYKKSAPI